MKTPPGYSEKEVLATIKIVTHHLAPKYTFGYHTVEDVEQEAFILALEALERFDTTKGGKLKTYIYTYVGNRLKNFKRDNYYRQEYTCKKCGQTDPLCKTCIKRAWRAEQKVNILEANDIHSVTDDAALLKDHDWELDSQEIFDAINSQLSLALREDFLKIRDGVHVPKVRRLVVEAAVSEIVKQWKDDADL